MTIFVAVSLISVIPAQAGIQGAARETHDPRFNSLQKKRHLLFHATLNARATVDFVNGLKCAEGAQLQSPGFAQRTLGTETANTEP